MNHPAAAALVFPARAGMSPYRGTQKTQTAGFPRPRGDEPLAVLVHDHQRMFSPPARG